MRVQPIMLGVAPGLVSYNQNRVCRKARHSHRQGQASLHTRVHSCGVVRDERNWLRGCEHPHVRRYVSEGFAGILVGSFGVVFMIYDFTKFASVHTCVSHMRRTGRLCFPRTVLLRCCALLSFPRVRVPEGALPNLCATRLRSVRL